jgi:hypothetical protein
LIGFLEDRGSASGERRDSANLRPGGRRERPTPELGDARLHEPTVVGEVTRRSVQVALNAIAAAGLLLSTDAGARLGRSRAGGRLVVVRCGTRKVDRADGGSGADARNEDLG